MSDLASAFARGALWSVGLRWAVKAIGLVSTVVLARLLTPQDFGIVAIAMLCVSFIDVLFSTGSESVVLRDPDAPRELVDSAWSFKLMESLCIAAALALAAPFAAEFFREPRLVPVILTLAVGLGSVGFASFGPLLARRSLDFALEVRLAVTSKVIAFAITLSLAVWLRNYWALVIGAVSGYVSGTLLSYVFHDYRPRFRVSHIRQIWSFSQWMVVSSIGNYFTSKADELLLARIGTTDQMGLYSVASDIGQTVTGELMAPMNRALLPVLARLNDTRQRLQDALGKMVCAANIVVLPAGFGLAAISTQTVDVLLGPKWAGAAPLLTIFAIAQALRYMIGPYPIALIVIGKPRTISVLVWIEAAVLIACALLLADRGVLGLAWARAIAAGVAVLAWISIGATFGFGAARFARAVWRPLAGAVAMFVLLRALPQEHWVDLPVADLVMRILTGTTLYCGWIVITWQLLGRPDGLESRVFALLRSLPMGTR